jgi:hypothetical protein
MFLQQKAGYKDAGTWHVRAMSRRHHGKKYGTVYLLAVVAIIVGAILWAAVAFPEISRI